MPKVLADRKLENGANIGIVLTKPGWLSVVVVEPNGDASFVHTTESGKEALDLYYHPEGDLRVWKERMKTWKSA